MTRQEHMNWCKKRALEYVDIGDGSQAIASMMSDLGKHPETAKSLRIAGMLMFTVDTNNISAVEKFINGFN